MGTQMLELMIKAVVQSGEDLTGASIRTRTMFNASCCLGRMCRSYCKGEDSKKFTYRNPMRNPDSIYCSELDWLASVFDIGIEVTDRTNTKLSTTSILNKAQQQALGPTLSRTAKRQCWSVFEL
ncbi:hypothetical protein CIHG_05256 [Coccidioides immitis H538.4]|uniref:Uncharacterized protein n=1 Tax=Coccidioides immitis H538.4 TaxID=396776 RepID=A0A0J8RQT9_COCIT|nr:hypothetical protein CIHG_05256 [Coccidioides immitis H538.4]